MHLEWVHNLRHYIKKFHQYQAQICAWCDARHLTGPVPALAHWRTRRLTHLHLHRHHCAWWWRHTCTWQHLCQQWWCHRCSRQRPPHRHLLCSIHAGVHSSIMSCWHLFICCSGICCAGICLPHCHLSCMLLFVVLASVWCTCCSIWHWGGAGVFTVFVGCGAGAGVRGFLVLGCFIVVFVSAGGGTGSCWWCLCWQHSLLVLVSFTLVCIGVACAGGLGIDAVRAGGASAVAGTMAHLSYNTS